MFAALATFIWIWRQYLSDQRQQRAAQTREALQAIVEDCSQFLRPLSEQYPYPILHTATAITKEFCSRMRKEPRGKDVLALLDNKKTPALHLCRGVDQFNPDLSHARHRRGTGA